MLFGNLLAISTEQLVVFALFTAGLAVVLVVIARPLVFASVDPQVAEAKGVPVRALGIVFMVLLALVITMAVQVVGTLLLFALVVTPAATALRTARPAVVAALGTAHRSRVGVARPRALGDVQPAAELLHRLDLVLVLAARAGGRSTALGVVGSARSARRPTSPRTRERDRVTRQEREGSPVASTSVTADVDVIASTRLRRDGQRYTECRRVLVAVLVEHGPLTIPEILRRRPNIAQSSAYRNLAVLERSGVVRRIITADEWARYELAEPLAEHHHHLICAACGAVVDFTVSTRLERSLDAAFTGSRTRMASRWKTTASTSSVDARRVSPRTGDR